MSKDSNEHRDIERLLGPIGDQLSCDQCFVLLDEYVELEHVGSDVDARLPGLRTHLEGCPACKEDYESLRALIVAEGPGRE
jgi:hypothetical protein